MHAVGNFTGSIKTRNDFARLVKNLHALGELHAAHGRGKARLLFDNVVGAFVRDGGLEVVFGAAESFILSFGYEVVELSNGLLERCSIDACVAGSFLKRGAVSKQRSALAVLSKPLVDLFGADAVVFIDQVAK